MPKTQSALLEAMAEHQVTVDGTTRALPDPFFLIATENPIEYEGTFPLPEAQLDRFALRSSLGYPAEQEELAIVREQRHGHPLDGLAPVVSLDEIVALRQACEDIYVDELLDSWIVRLVRATRTLDEVEVGASVRGSLALVKVARAWALLQRAGLRRHPRRRAALRPGARAPADAHADVSSPRPRALTPRRDVPSDPGRGASSSCRRRAPTGQRTATRRRAPGRAGATTQ